MSKVKQEFTMSRKLIFMIVAGSIFYSLFIDFDRDVTTGRVLIFIDVLLGYLLLFLLDSMLELYAGFGEVKFPFKEFVIGADSGDPYTPPLCGRLTV